MPTYEYVCTSCHAPIEVVQSMHEPALTDCPSCADGRLRKVFGNVGVVFKGSGFYRTDSRGKSAGADRPDSKPKGSQPASGTQASDGKSSSSATKSATSDSTSSAGAGRSSGSAKSASSASRGSGSAAGTATRG